MPDARPSRSFEPDGAHTVTAPGGQIAHAAHVAQSERLARRLYEVMPGVWTLVGNGLSNQTFVDAPEGIIAIDTGESVEEMASALGELRAVTDRPIVAVLYTHFHYVNGTAAVLAERPGVEVPIHGHERIAGNLRRAGGEVAPTYGRGLVEQFAVAMPTSGPDGTVNVGLGNFYRDPAHAPFTGGHVPVTHPFDGATVLQVAGLEVHVQPAPSDADDSVTFWFPALGVAVHNLVWPVLFNVFAIRGEEYRDPRVMLTGLDHLLSLGADHLVATHGPPMSGRDEIARRVTRYRDSIQFLWDQTVRHTNRGLSSVEVGHAVRLPDQCDDDFITSELYGVTEHHARQIRSGLFGFFDGDPANLFPLPPAERARRTIAGFGGREVVRAQVTEALNAGDARWAVELASMLVRDDGDETDRHLLASALRMVAQRTSAANIRNWCITRARELDGSLDLERLRQHRFSTRQVLAGGAVRSVPVLRVLLDPEAAVGVDTHVRWEFDDGTSAGLHVRNCVAVPTEGEGADVTVRCSPQVWAELLGGQRTLSAALADGSMQVVDDVRRLQAALRVFDVEGLRS
ncbi:MAG: MBL fold metallo-hydrolase [Actinobacteria bacterium]|nr:MBL fold metallo-hydrolase [Actinomycetota bacterium]